MGGVSERSRPGAGYGVPRWWRASRPEKPGLCRPCYNIENTRQRVSLGWFLPPGAPHPWEQLDRTAEEDCRRRMSRLEDLQPNAAVRGILPDALVTVVSVQWFGSEALELTYKDAGRQGRERAALPARRAAPRDRRAGPAVELRRRRRALPPRLRGAAHPPRASLRSRAGGPHLGRRSAAAPDHGGLRGDAAAAAAALPARRRSRRRQDDHGGPAHQGADRPRRPPALPDRLPRQPRRAVAGRALPPLPPAVRDPHQRQARSRAHRQLVPGERTSSSPASTSCRATRTCSRSSRRRIAAGTSSSATRRTRCRPRSSAARSKYTKRYRLGQLLSTLTRHFLLMTATPHNGKEEDFQLFMALLDGDRFEGRFRDGVHAADVSDLMRRMVKENLLKFDGTPLFPERIAYTVPYKLSDGRGAALQGGHRLRARGVQPRRGAAERQARRHGRLRADHPAAPPRLLARGDLPVAAPPPRAARKPAARAGAAPARRPGRAGPGVHGSGARRRGRRGSGGRARQRGRGGRGGDPRSGDRGAHDRRAEDRDRDAQASWRRSLSPSAAAARTPSGASWPACSARSSRRPRSPTASPSRRRRTAPAPIPPPDAVAAPEAGHLHRAPRHAELPGEPHHARCSAARRPS